ncbi:MAG: cytochrome c [Deltaproteobacteria bacterium]|nr:cytochrome c [Deltaproteobacteria bacterium]MBN2671963.1 cytochrome c [Deltaproteobacteria bacterium]
MVIRKLSTLLVPCALAISAVILFSDLAQTTSKNADWQHLKDGRDVFLAACAACHGMDGAGNKQSSVAFETELPDFTDCNFTSREPAADWYQIARIGGPVRGFDPMMPAFGEALTPEQLESSITHIKSFCADDKWPDGVFNLPKALVTGKAYPEDEYMFLFSFTPGGLTEFQGKFVTEKRLGARHQLELAAPFVVKQIMREGSDESAWGEGVGDIALGYKLNLLASIRSLTIISLSTEVLLPTGDEYDEIGKGYFRFEPFITMGQIIPHVGFLQLQAGAELSTRPEKGAHELFWRGTYGQSFSKDGYGRTWSPMVEILGARELEDDANVEWHVVPEVQVTLNQRQHIMFCMGAKIPLTDFDSGDIQYMAYLLWDWFDGGFTEGW